MLQILDDNKACPKALHDFTWGYYHALCRQWTPSALAAHGKSASSVAVSPDGKTLATSSDDGTIKLWDAETRKERTTLRGHKGGVNYATFNHDGTLLASASHDKTVKLWDVATGQTVATLEGHTGQVTCAAFSPDGKWLVSGSKVFDPKEKNSDARYKDGEVRLWNVAERKQERLLYPKQDTAITFVAFSPDGQTVAASTSQRSDVRLLEVATGKVLDQFPGTGGWVYRVAFSPDGRTLSLVERGPAGLLARPGDPPDAPDASRPPERHLWPGLVAGRQKPSLREQRRTHQGLGSRHGQGTLGAARRSVRHRRDGVPSRRQHSLRGAW